MLGQKVSEGFLSLMPAGCIDCHQRCQLSSQPEHLHLVSPLATGLSHHGWDPRMSTHPEKARQI